MSAALNILLILIMGALILGGLRRGLRRELINLLGVVAAVAGGALLARPVGALFARIGIMEEVPWVVAFLGGFAAASLVFSIAKTPFLPRHVDLAERISGGLVGFLKGMLAAALFVYLLSGLWPRAAEAFGDAPAARFVMPLTRLVAGAADGLGILLPDELRQRLREGHRELRDAIEGAEQMLGGMEEVGDRVREYADRAGQGAAVADPPAPTVVPPSDH